MLRRNKSKNSVSDTLFLRIEEGNAFACGELLNQCVSMAGMFTFEKCKNLSYDKMMEETKDDC